MASGESGQAGKNENAEFIVMGSPFAATADDTNQHKRQRASERMRLTVTVAIASRGQRCEFSMIGRSI
ncbi:hypothetical protein BN2475_340099 [Paraburkholderia ribeironis]|uniref:Uncharacterized protein n=1 Tax=Paraburkholderia ribeironis TaxID=1247936 RepID=A0A1N7S3Z1_9BURK|nr:hypothetical protein BN2475_340099 [Paraburkholderia ribeironis]